MGVESDRLVFDYLSRVADLAQTALPAQDRMRLVSRLRTDIDQARGEGDSAAAVQRILGRIGSPDDVVEAAAGSRGPAAPGDAGEPPATEPPPGSYGPYAKPRPPGRAPAGARRADGDLPPQRAEAPAPPGGRPRAKEPDWWSGGLGEPRLRSGDEVAGLPGMTGEIFIPVDDGVLAGKEPPPPPRAPVEEPAAEDAAAAGSEEAPQRGSLLRRLLRAGRRGADGGAARGWGSPVLLLAAALLVAGAVIGSWIPLGLGWLVGYLSRALTRTQAKFAVFVLPGAAAVGLGIWLWGRDAGKWSTPVAQGQMGQAAQDALPFTVRAAAVSTALYLLWRSRRSA